jgi:hypothetical protein
MSQIISMTIGNGQTIDEATEVSKSLWAEMFLPASDIYFHEAPADAARYAEFLTTAQKETPTVTAAEENFDGAVIQILIDFGIAVGAAATWDMIKVIYIRTLAKKLGGSVTESEKQ